MAEDKPLWDQQPWDTEASFKCFRLWLFQEQRPRSLDAAYRERVGRQYYADGTTLLRASPAARRWYQALDGKSKRITDKSGQPVPTWEDRAKAYDAHLAELDRLQWEQRRADIRERGYANWEALNAKAAQMLQFPLQTVSTTEYYEDGRPKTVVIEPGKWALRDAAALMKIAEEIGRLAAEMANERHELMIPPEVVNIWGPFAEALKAVGLDPIEALKAVMAQVEAEKSSDGSNE